MSPNFLLKCLGSGARHVTMVTAAVALLGGCSTYDSLTQRVAQSITPYRITVVQGNFVSKEAAARMRVGMTRAEVRTVLGTPLLTDMFHAERWDYLFYFKRGSTSVVQQRDFVVNFKDDRVASWQGGDALPSELELLADIDGDKGGKKAKAKAAAAAASEAAVAATASAVTAGSAGSAGSSAADAAANEPEANAQAAQAANRAVNQAQTPRQAAPGSRASAAPAPGAPAGAVRQFQFQREPQPAQPGQSEPVGPTSPQGDDTSSPRTQPLTATQDKAASGS